MSSPPQTGRAPAIFRPEGPEPSRRRVRLALDALTPFTRQVIADAVRLAAQEGGAIDCVFVEQASLMRAAVLPSTRELGPGVAPRNLDPTELTRALQRQAEETRRLITRQAAARGLVSSFHIAHGALIDEALAHADEQDLLLAAIAGCEPEPMPSQLVSRTCAAHTMLALVESLSTDLPTLRALLRSMPQMALSVWTHGNNVQNETELQAQLHRLALETGRPASRIQGPVPLRAGQQNQAGQADTLAAQLNSTLERMRPQLLAMQRDMLASLASELSWSMRRRPALLVGIPRSRNH